MFLILFMICCVHAGNKTLFDAYYGRPATDEELKRFEEANNTFWCVNEIELPCDPSEGRRFDGTCNNLRYPWKGAPHTPLARMLPAAFGTGYEERKAKSGNDLPLARRLRTSLLREGHVPNQEFTHLVTHFFLFIFGDFISIHDTINYVAWKPYCCEEEGKTDNMCAPIKVPDDDPVHRFSNIRCMGLTKPITYQNIGCVDNTTVPSRLLTNTPFFDLSQIYGRGANLAKARLYKGGLLNYETEDGRVWPPSIKGNPNSICVLNQLPVETKCHDTPEKGLNSILGSILFGTWIWRYHNLIAKELAKVNSSWDDEKIFQTARDINIAVIAQIVYYELLPALMGWENLVQDGVISPSPGFRDIYDENLIPQTYLEFPHVGRWGHTIQPGNLGFYDTDGNHLRNYPEVNLTLRTGFLHIGNNMDYMTQGSFRQPIAKADYTVDSYIAELGLGPLQEATDITASDLAKDRLFGLPPYIKYRDFCADYTHTSFDDLSDVIDPERIEMLKNQYESIEDVDLMSGLWLEAPVDGGYVPTTVYCLLAKQFLRIVEFDRFWYERENRPKPFTIGQLQEVRKASIAQLLCDVGDKVTKIQPHAFLRSGPGNPITTCNSIPRLDFGAWRDNTCK